MFQIFPFLTHNFMFKKRSSEYTKIILMKDGTVTNTETTSLLDNEALEDDNDPKGIKGFLFKFFLKKEEKLINFKQYIKYRNGIF